MVRATAAGALALVSWCGGGQNGVEIKSEDWIVWWERWAAVTLFIFYPTSHLLGLLTHWGIGPLQGKETNVSVDGEDIWDCTNCKVQHIFWQQSCTGRGWVRYISTVSHSCN